MKKGNKVVFGIFENRSAVETAVSALRSARFRSSDISVLMPALGDESTFAHSKGSKAPEGAAAGVSLGALLGGTFGWLVGVGAIAVAPPLGVMLAAGPIMSALAAAGAAGAIGGLTGALVGFGIPEYEAKRYEDYVKEGGLLLSVHVDDEDWLGKAQHILESAGARDVSATTEVPNNDVSSTIAAPPAQGTYYPDIPPYML